MCNILFGISEQYFYFDTGARLSPNAFRLEAVTAKWTVFMPQSVPHLTHTLRDVQAEQSQCFRDFYPSRGFIC